jgi:hypothetical protein
VQEFQREKFGKHQINTMKASPLSVSARLVACGWIASQTVLASSPPVGPASVPGKEYSDNLDTPVPGQILLWDGSGNVSPGPILPTFGVGELDAAANRRDAYFHAVSYNNSVSLLFSVKGDSPNASIWYENPDGSHGVWATKDQINKAGVRDLDALEVWGPNGVSDTDFLSLHGDPGGAAIRTKGGALAMTASEIALAIGLIPGAGTVNGITLSDAEISRLTSRVQLDGLMYYRNQTDDAVIDLGPNDRIPSDAFFGDSILFSIEPIQLPNGDYLFDGGEIWTHNISAVGPAQFLNHGGHLWNTDFDVAGTFGLGSEDIDALEAAPAVPEAGTMAASGLLAALIGSRLWRRRRQS